MATRAELEGLTKERMQLQLGQANDSLRQPQNSPRAKISSLPNSHQEAQLQFKLTQGPEMISEGLY